MKKILFTICIFIFGTFLPLEILSEEKYTPYKDSETVEVEEFIDLINKEYRKSPEEILSDPYMAKYINDFIDWTNYLNALDLPEKTSDRTPKDLIKVYPDIPTKAALELLPCMISWDESKGNQLIEAGNKSLEISPNWFAYQCRGLGNYYLGKNIEAIKDLKKSLEMMPKYYLPVAAETFNYMALSKYELKEYKDAITDVNGAIAASALIKDPKGRYFHNRGLFLYMASDEEPKYKVARLKQARKDFSNAIKLKSIVRPNSYYLRAMTNYQLNKNDKKIICDDLFKAEQLGIENDFSKSFCE
tara:strand:+ start:47 stop:952 length:906 start_codon:yes stop_codon:yes gene_type:complete